MADYGRSIGFKGTFLIEPKPMEPTKHQYDYDAATTIAFIEHWGLEKDFKCNIEANHALAGHSFAMTCKSADRGLLGSVDANRVISSMVGIPMIPTSIEHRQAMLVILNAGGLGNGGLNFDARSGVTQPILKTSSLHTSVEWIASPSVLRLLNKSSTMACSPTLPTAIAADSGEAALR